MGEKTKIQWCDDTLNFWRGCTKVSAGCQNCYAERNLSVKLHGIQWGPGKPRRERLTKARAEALRWNAKPWICDGCGTSHKIRLSWCDVCSYAPTHHPRRVFTLSLGDWLDPEVPIEWLASMLDTIRECPKLTWILCSKRPELWTDRLFAAGVASNQRDDYRGGGPADWIEGWMQGQPPPNIILLASVENQEMADKRIPELLRIPAALHGLSLEPLIGPVNLRLVPFGLRWIIVGGESGPEARRCNIQWIRTVVEQCAEIKLPCFVKQMGSRCYEQRGNQRVHIHHDDPKGADPAEWPEDLRVRQFPTL